MKIIPAIDLIEGKCVRLTQGDYAKKTIYNNNPVEVAKSFEDHGLKYLHLVDLDGAKSSKVVNWKILENIATQTQLHIDFGGGVKSDEDIRIVFDSGARQVTAGSIAVKSPETVFKWLDEFGADRIILGADVKDKKIAIHGWMETSSLEWRAFLQNYLTHGIREVICTDVSKDGMLAGSSDALYAEIISEFPKIQLIASGGVQSIDELSHLRELGLYGAIIGKAIYEGQISLHDLALFQLD